MHVHPKGAEKIGGGGKFPGEVLSAQRAPPGRAIVQFFYEIWTAGVVNLVVLVYGLKLTTKKVVNFFREEKCTREKILATPMPTV